MIPVSSAISGGLVWSRNGSGFELKRNNELVGCLRKTSFWSLDYLADSDYGNWRFCRSGRFGNDVEVKQDGSNACVANFKKSWGGPGTFTFADGQAFQVVAEGCWRRIWKVTAADGQPVLRLRTREKTVELENQSALPESRLLLLVLLILYRMLQDEQDGAVVAMIAAVG